MNALSVICKQELVLRGYDQPYRFVGSIKSRARLNQERTERGARRARGAVLGFPGVSAKKECGIHSLAFADSWATSGRE